MAAQISVLWKFLIFWFASFFYFYKMPFISIRRLRLRYHSYWVWCLHHSHNIIFFLLYVCFILLHEQPVHFQFSTRTGHVVWNYLFTHFCSSLVTFTSCTLYMDVLHNVHLLCAISLFTVWNYDTPKTVSMLQNISLLNNSMLQRYDRLCFTRPFRKFLRLFWLCWTPKYIHFLRVTARSRGFFSERQPRFDVFFLYPRFCVFCIEIAVFFMHGLAFLNLLLQINALFHFVNVRHCFLFFLKFLRCKNLEIYNMRNDVLFPKPETKKIKNKTIQKKSHNTYTYHVA